MIPYSLNSKDIKKGTCPNCGHANRFSHYVNNETLEKIGDRFGKCDRIESCNYHLVPGKDSVSFSKNYVPPAAKPTLFHSHDLVKASQTNFNDNNFVQFLISIVGEERTKEAIDKYRIGTSDQWNGTIFWQIDKDNRVHHGKIMAYDKITGKRVKTNSGKALISSVRAKLKLYNYELNQCLFGLHLIDTNSTQPIAVVESEKTAIIMSIFLPQYIWTSTGSFQGFKYSILEPIKKHKIVAFPDAGCYDRWNTTATKLNMIGFDITVSKIIESENVASGTDLADILITEKKMSPVQSDSMCPENKFIEEEYVAFDNELGKNITFADYEGHKTQILFQESNEEKTCFDLEGNRITQKASDEFIEYLQKLRVVKK